MKSYRYDTASTFTSDLQDAHDRENQLKQFFENNYNCTVKTSQDKGAFSDYDLSVEFKDSTPNITIEVKMDKVVERTGNVAVEYQRTHKDGTIRPTCISATKADVWTYWFEGAYHFIETECLRQLITDKKYFTTIHGAGDGDRASIVLFKKEVFNQNCTIIKP